MDDTGWDGARIELLRHVYTAVTRSTSCPPSSAANHHHQSRAPPSTRGGATPTKQDDGRSNFAYLQTHHPASPTTQSTGQALPNRALQLFFSRNLAFSQFTLT